MSYASGTTHYNLPQTVGSDKRDWTDTNQAFSDIDAAIYGAAQGASAATSAIQTINGEIETITTKQAVDEGNISTLSGKVSTLESTVGTQAAAIADVRQDLQDNIESNHEASATSSHAYEVGDTFYYNDVLYKATAQIAIGGTIVPSTNCTAITVMSEIDQVNSDLTELEWTRINSITADGTIKWSDALNALYSNAVAQGKFDTENYDYRIKWITDNNQYIFSNIIKTASSATFNRVFQNFIGNKITTYTCFMQDSASKYIATETTTSGTTFTDSSTAVLTGELYLYRSKATI